VHLDQYENRRILIDDAKPIIIEKNVWIALNCVILPGTNIGKGSIVGANSVVHGNIPAYSIVVGNPAVVVGKIRIK
jgi:acetyltransferase-like isoleucine patch superfamily enzyme